MIAEDLDRLAESVLYSRKNRLRFSFGRIYPEACGLDRNGAEPWLMQTEIPLSLRSSDARATVEIRFLQAYWREIAEATAPDTVVSVLEHEGELYQTWQEAEERRLRTEIELTPGTVRSLPFVFSELRSCEAIPSRDGPSPGFIRHRAEEILGAVELAVIVAGGGLCKLAVRILNQTPVPPEARPDSDGVLLRTLAATHTLLQAENADFISVTAPAAQFGDVAGSCRNIGTWPVLVGNEAAGERGTVFSSSIILPDYPQIAPEIAGDFYAGTEIDEIPSSRILILAGGH